MKPVVQRNRFWPAAGWAAFALAVLIALLVYCQLNCLVVVGIKNGELLSSAYTMWEDPFDHPRLRLLRTREKLDEVVVSGKTQFEKILLLRRWARRQWQSGDYFYYPAWDAVEILDLARNHANRAFCAQYAIVFLQALQSMGIHARYVDLPGHFVVGVWSDDYDRWILMDPTGDIHFERDGAPLRGRDLFDSYWKKNVRGIEKVSSEGTRVPVVLDDLAVFRAYSIDLYANQLSEPVNVIVNGVKKSLTRASDYKSYPFVGRENLGIASMFLAWKQEGVGEYFTSERPRSDDADDFRYAINQTYIVLPHARNVGSFLKILLLQDNNLNFQNFLVQSDQDRDWAPVNTNRVKWVLHPGMNRFRARIQTKFGWLGKISEISVYRKHSFFSKLPRFEVGMIKLTLR